MFVLDIFIIDIKRAIDKYVYHPVPYFFTNSVFVLWRIEFYLVLRLQNRYFSVDDPMPFGTVRALAERSDRLCDECPRRGPTARPVLPSGRDHPSCHQRCWAPNQSFRVLTPRFFSLVLIALLPSRAERGTLLCSRDRCCTPCFRNIIFIIEREMRGVSSEKEKKPHTVLWEWRRL